MNSDGERFDQALMIVRVIMGANQTLDVALNSLPPDLRDLQGEVRAKLQAEQDQPIYRANILSKGGGPLEWFRDWRPSDGYHWNRLRRHLFEIGREMGDVDSLDDSSSRILSHIEDPRDSGPESFQIRGLVLGYIQSGKTANISALIAKAADLGYKRFIIFSGMSNGLRQQTQQRLSRELGFAEDNTGVGFPDRSHGRWVSLTRDDYEGDFQPGTVTPDWEARTIAIVKKNVHVLRKLIDFMERAPSGSPILMVDDEADQASINTRGNRPLSLEEQEDEQLPEQQQEDQDPSRINELIRRLIQMFSRVSYVAYTATPFANVLIDPDAADRLVERDLYPKDFIISLPKPANYVGAQELFGRDALGDEDEGLADLGVVRIIPSGELGGLIPPTGQGVEGFYPSIERSLEGALRDFVLATAARESRLGPGPATMLIHTSQRTVLHESLCPLIDEHLREMKQRWNYDKNSIFPELQQCWNDDFRPVTVSLNSEHDQQFGEIESFVNQFFQDLPKVLVLNSLSDDSLDYKREPHLRAVVIGGNRLSRGLTLENLLVSYYVRRSRAYDTLLQMGRWFGYRSRYVDLTRLWTTEDLFKEFQHLSLVEEEFRDQVEIYAKSKKTPMDFAPAIRKHPELAVTAENKMRSARNQNWDFSAELKQTSRFHLDNHDWLVENLQATRNFLSGMGPYLTDSDGRPEWRDVSWQKIYDFLCEYQSAHLPQTFGTIHMRNYIREQAKLGELLNWRVSVISLRNRDNELGIEFLGNDDTIQVNTISRSQKVSDRGSIGVLTNPIPADWSEGGDESIGLSEVQIRKAREEYEFETHRRRSVALRMQRAKEEGLLLIYPISRFSKPRPGSRSRISLFPDDAENACTVVGLALVFPPSDSGATVEYVVGPTGQRMETDEP